jgi:hypothetical protein
MSSILLGGTRPPLLQLSQRGSERIVRVALSAPVLGTGARNGEVQVAKCFRFADDQEIHTTISNRADAEVTVYLTISGTG